MAFHAPPASAGSNTSTSFALTTYRGMTSDPVTGRVFVAGDDRIRVFNADGTLLTTINNVYGASAPFVDGGSLWVGETTAGAVARIDIASSTVAQTFTVGIPVTGSVAIHGGLVWFTTPAGSTTYTALSTLDPLTGVVTMRGGSFYQAFIRTIPGSANRLLIGEPGLSPFSVYLIDTSGPTVAVLDDVPHGVGSNLKDLAVSGDGQRMVTASGAPYRFPQFSLSNMDPDGLSYPATNYPNGVAFSPAGSGLFAGTVAANKSLFVWADGRPAIATRRTVAAETVDAGVELAADGSRAYVVAGSGGNRTLETYDLRAAIDVVTPSQSVQGVPTAVDVFGPSLGALSAVSVGGVPADFTQVSPDQVRVQIPTTLATGPHTLTATGPLGAPSATVEVVANIGATLTGFVRSSGIGIPGIEVTLSHNGASSTTVTSSADGSFSFSGVPYGTNYRLGTHDPSGVYFDQQIEGFTLVPNNHAVQDIDLQSPPATTGASLARVPLPPGQVRDVEFEPATSRVFVSLGDEVMVFSRDGVLVSRIKDQFGADGIALGQGAVWVNLRTAGRINRIDPSTATVTGSWATTTATTGGLSHDGAKLHFTDGDDQWVSLARLDPATGAVQKTGGLWYQPRLANVAGTTSRAFLFTQGISSGEVAVLDTSSARPLTLKSSGTSGGSDWLANATLDRVWSSSGRERRLSTLGETGVQYPLNGSSTAVAYSPGSGGVLATGRTLSRPGIPAATHILDDTPSVRALALDSAGDRAYLVAGDTFVVWTLAPTLQSSSPGISITPGPLQLKGTGLTTASTLTLDGSPIAFTVDNPNQVTIEMPPVPAGVHELQVTTDWGTSRILSIVTRPPYRAVNDFDGDAVSDIAVFRPSDGTWYTKGATSEEASPWGTAGDIPVPADYDGDGDADLAVFRPSTGVWYVKGTPASSTAWGIDGDIPVPADYSGDHLPDVAVFRPSTGVWYLNPGGSIPWGTEGDIPA